MTKNKDGAKKAQPENKTQKGTAQASTDAGAVNEAAKAKAAEEAKAKEEEAAKAKAAEEAKAKEEEAAKAKAAEEAKAKKEEAAKAKKGKDARPIFKDDRGLQFRFKKNAPKTLNIDGKSTKVSDIIKDNEVMLELIYGNSNFIEQIY